MIWKTTILLSSALCVLGDGHHAISEQRIKIIHKEHSKEHHGHHGELSHIGSKKPEHHEEYAWSYPSYEFSYKVHDPHTHDMKGQHESREGDAVKGEYWLVEPDGRKRTVTYHADKHSGFHATVHYSDDHHHEEPKKIKYHEEPKNEEEKKEEEEAGGEEGGEEGGEGQEEEGGGNEGAAVVEEVDEGRGAEESRGREEEVGKWIHDHYWGYRGNDRYNKHHGYKHEDDRRHDGHYQGHYHMVRGDEEHKHDEHKHKSMSIFTGLGSYGRRHGHERAEWLGHEGKPVKDETREESRRRPEHRGFAQPKPKNAAVVRENYYHPRYYRQREHQRKNPQ